MFILKKKYFLIIESIKDIQLINLNKPYKIVIIYRYKKLHDTIPDIFNFSMFCKTKRIKLFIANDILLCKTVKADGVYISATNFNLKYACCKNFNLEVIGSAHNRKEILIKRQQGCKEVILSRLFQTSYKYKEGFLGVVRFNLLNAYYQNKLIPLGGIRLANLNKLKILNSHALVLFSEIKKKPAIIDRLF